MFGSCGYWRDEAPGGSIEQRAEALLALWRQREIKQLAPADNPGAAKDIVRAMALELGVASTRLGNGFPKAVVELVLEVLPKWAFAMVDPSVVYSGKHAGKGAPDPLQRMKLKAKCRDVDCAYAAKTGQKKLAKVLAEEMIEFVRTTSEFKSLAVAWRDAPNVERTVRRWRKEYATDLEEAISSR